MNFRGAPRRRDDATIELTPLIDVVFLLLIFFLLTSALTQATQQGSVESAIPVDLPEAGSGSSTIEQEPLILTVKPDGGVAVEGRDTVEGSSLVDTLNRLYEIDPDAQILLRGDRQATHGRVTELLALIKQIGFKRADLLIEASAAPAAPKAQ